MPKSNFGVGLSGPFSKKEEQKLTFRPNSCAQFGQMSNVFVTFKEQISIRDKLQMSSLLASRDKSQIVECLDPLLQSSLVTLW